MTQLLEIEGLVAGYDSVPVVHDISLCVGSGEIVALLGRNGAGKSTTLLAVSGIVPVLAGSITIFGQPVDGLRNAHRIARRGVAHVPESRGVLSQLTVRENLELARPSGRVRLEPAIEWFPQLLPILDRRAALCSGGEQQMVALARALLSVPKLLIVDEMSLGLAPSTFEALLSTVAGYVKNTEIGVLIVEQYVDAILGIADYAYVLRKGEIAMAAPAADMRADRAQLESMYMD